MLFLTEKMINNTFQLNTNWELPHGGKLDNVIITKYLKDSDTAIKE